jgi:hypothetical protein
MRARYLFPYKSRFLGIFLILAHVPIMMIWDSQKALNHYHDFSSLSGESSLFSPAHLYFIATSLLMLIGLFLIAFSKEKIEDEQIAQLRLDSLRWSIYLNYLILILCIIFTNGIDFLDMLRLNLWVPLVFFIIRFRWVIFRLNRSSKSTR